MTLLFKTLFFDMNSFFASVAQQEEPALIGHPVGVLTADRPNAACIAASIEAKALGIGMGMRQAEMRQICPDIVFRPARHDVCVDYHHAIRAAAEEILPIREAHSVDEFSCDLLGRQQELSVALDIAQHVQANILRKVGRAMRSSVGIAPNRLLAKLASEMQKPDGIYWLHPDVLPGKIAHLNLRDIPGISRRMEKRLHRADIWTVTQLYALAPKHARHLWGNVNGERFIRELRGERVTWPKSGNHSLGHGQVLTRENRTPDGARLVTRRLLVKAATRLRRANLYASSLFLSVKCQQHGQQSWYGKIQATQDSIFLLQMLERYWPTLQFTQPRAVSIALGGLMAEPDVTQDLFAERTSEQQAKRVALCRAVDGLNQRYGANTVSFGELPRYLVPYTGAKIAFTRVPSKAEFND